MHPRFDVTRYVSSVTGFSVPEVITKMEDEKGLIELVLAVESNNSAAARGGPRGVVGRELMERILAGKVDFGKSFEVDLVIWRKRHHKHPFLTRLGGIPWRDRSLPWPTTESGQNYTFVGQYCLSEMISPVPFTPKSDLILVFSYDENLCSGTVLLEWGNTNLTDPVQEEDCPQPQFSVPQYFAELQRVTVYPDFHQMERVYEEIPKQLERVLGYEPMPQNTLIGTEAFWHQENYCKDTVLCTLSTFDPYDTEWPFSDQQAPLEREISYDQTFDNDKIMPSAVWTMYFQSRNGEDLLAVTERG